MTTQTPCALEGCTRPRATQRRWCNHHYMRKHRYGDPYYSPAPVRRPVILQSHGYVKLHNPGHPLADRDGYVYEHRAVLWSKTHGLPTNCHWCGCALVWGRNLQVDHLDSVKTNNTPANLVPSCGSCNVRRAMSIRWHRNDWLTHPPVRLFPLAPKEIHA